MVRRAIDRLSVEFGLRILGIVSGRVSTEVDARLSFDTKATIEKARVLIEQYEAAGASRERVLIKIASTWEGIRAAEVAREGGHPLQPDAALRDAPGDRLRRGRRARSSRRSSAASSTGTRSRPARRGYEPHEDPGVVSVTRIYDYFKHFGHKTEIMGASFRNLGEITELAGCDLLDHRPELPRGAARRREGDAAAQARPGEGQDR